MFTAYQLLSWLHYNYGKQLYPSLNKGFERKRGKIIIFKFIFLYFFLIIVLIFIMIVIIIVVIYMVIVNSFFDILIISNNSSPKIYFPQQVYFIILHRMLNTLLFMNQIWSLKISLLCNNRLEDFTCSLHKARGSSGPHLKFCEFFHFYLYI